MHIKIAIDHMKNILKHRYKENLDCLLRSLTAPHRWWAFADDKFIEKMMTCLTKSGKKIFLKLKKKKRPFIFVLNMGH